MPEEAPSLDRLIKMMKMTTASEDTLALVAIRKANEEVARFGGDWEAILRGKIKVIEDPFKNLDNNLVRREAPPPPPRPASPPPPPPRPQPRWTQPAPQPRQTAAANPFAPPPPKPKFDCHEAKKQGRVNQYPGHCHDCGGYVSPTAGFILSAPGGGWKVFHAPGNCKKAASGGPLDSFA